MDFLNEIKNLSDEELEKLVKEKIDFISKESYEFNEKTDIIGFNLEENPKFNLQNHSEGSDYSLDVICGYEGYIKKGMKIVYGLSFNHTKLVTNNGAYYYLDNDDYILKFCKYIKDKEINNSYIFFDYVLKFIHNYFRLITIIDREDMLNMIYKNDYNVYKKTHENLFSLFKEKGNARCSEYAVLAQNILSFFDYDMIYVIGREKDDNEEDGINHVFNIISYYDEVEKKDMIYLIDFSINVDEFDFIENKKASSPFISEIEKEDLNDFLYNNMHLSFDDYEFVKLGNTLVCLNRYGSREYYVSSEIMPNNGKKLYKGI